jgi:hypothetical protein
MAMQSTRMERLGNYKLLRMGCGENQNGSMNNNGENK